jgi:hypothetical protein
LRSRQPFCRGRSAFVAGLALVGLNNAAQATIGSEYATSVTLPLAHFPKDNETDAAPSPPIVLAQAAPAAGGSAPDAEGSPGGTGNAAPGPRGNEGYLLWSRDGALVAQGFNASTLKLFGEPRTVADHVATMSVSGQIIAAASTTGLLLFTAFPPQKQFTWRDRAGKTV